MLKNQLYEYQTNKHLREHMIYMLTEKMNIVFESVDQISNARNLEEKYKMIIER